MATDTPVVRSDLSLECRPPEIQVPTYGHDQVKTREDLVTWTRLISQAAEWLRTKAPVLADLAGRQHPEPLARAVEAAVRAAFAATLELLRQVEQYTEEYDEDDYRYPEIAARDMRRWEDIHALATTLYNHTMRLDQDTNITHYLPRTDPAGNGLGYPGEAEWLGAPAAAYHSQIEQQAGAADQLARLAASSSDFLRVTSSQFAGLMTDLWNLLLMSLVFVTATVAAVVALLSASYTGPVGIVAAILGFVFALMQRYSGLVPAIKQYEMDRAGFWRNVNPPITRLNESLHARHEAISTSGRWPDPTTEGRFPRTIVDPSTGRRRIITWEHTITEPHLAPR